MEKDRFGMSQKEPSLDYLKWDYVPELREPFFVAGFHGWSDAGSVSTDTLQYLMEQLRPRTFASLSNEPFVNYALDRPVGEIEDGIIRNLEPMATMLTFCSIPEGKHDLVLSLGREPNFNWLMYTSTLLEAMQRLGVKRLYTLGGVQDTISHTASPRISVVASSGAAVAASINIEENIQPADYYGPVSIHSYLVGMCEEREIEAISLWGHVPAYLQKNPRMIARMVTIIGKAAGMECPTESLVKKSIELDRRIDEILAKDPNLKQFVENIEGKGDPPPQGGGDNVIRLNDFLRRDSHKDPQT
jgi:proteasome assembly chaperone (PAC2) family protein